MVKAMKKPTKKPAESTDQRHKQLREALLQAAERTIETDGYQALRARSLAEDVGCAVGAIYNVFPDLDALALAVKSRIIDVMDAELAQAVATAAEKGASPEQAAIHRLLALAQAYLRFAVERAARWRMLFEYRVAPGNTLPDWYVERLDAVFTHVDAPLRVLVPGLADDRRAELGRGLFSAVHGIVVLGLEQKLYTFSPETIAAQAETIVRAAIAGLMLRDRRDEIIRV
jgi:AcrR family transcriptional regulator